MEDKKREPHVVSRERRVVDKEDSGSGVEGAAGGGGGGERGEDRVPTQFALEDVAEEDIEGILPIIFEPTAIDPMDEPCLYRLAPAVVAEAPMIETRCLGKV